MIAVDFSGIQKLMRVSQKKGGLGNPIVRIDENLAKQVFGDISNDFKEGLSTTTGAFISIEER